MSEKKAMQIEIDPSLCVSSGRCVFTAPELFDQRDEDGTAFLIKNVLTDSENSTARDAAMRCPSGAIYWTEHEDPQPPGFQIKS